MKALIQRVSEAEVWVDQQRVSRIGVGILTFLGVEKGDNEETVDKMLQKILQFRIFPDEAGKMNRSLLDIGGEHLLVSQFTLAADCNSGRRPSFTAAENPQRAHELYALALKKSQESGCRSQGGVFQADMQVKLCNDGPVTFIFSL